MAVIINELEVIVERPQPSGARGAGEAPPPGQSGATVHPHDYEDVLDRMRRYDLRVAAH